MTEPNDKLLDEYLRRESPVSQRYRELEAQDVPPQLDAAVLAQAHAAIEHRNRRKPNWVKWGAPLALAASAVIAVAIVLEVGVQDEVRMPAPQLERATSAQRAQETRLIEEISPNPPVENAATESVLSEAPPQADASAQERQQVLDRAPNVQSASERGPVPPMNVAEQAERTVVRDVTASASDVQASSGMAPQQRAEERENSARGAADAGRAAREERPDLAFARNRGAIEPAPARAPQSTAALSQRTSIASAVPAEQAPRLPPEEWLDQIRSLRRDGKVLEADEQWDEFRKTYPEFEVAETDSARPKP